MARVTVRASNSTEAMEKITRHLGHDAFILATLSENGMIEITATDDEDEAAEYARLTAVPAKPRKPEPIVEDPAEVAGSLSIFSRDTRMNQPKRRIDIDVDAPVEIEAIEHAPKAYPAKQKFSRVLQFEQQRNASEAGPYEKLLGAGRLVLIGPAGAGKSMVSMQIALARHESNGAISTMAFTGSTSRADAAWLEHKAQFIGLPYGFSQPDGFGPARPDGTEIVVVSGRGPNGARPVLPPSVTAGAQVVLVIPTGLRRDRVEALCAPWLALDPIAVLAADPGEEIAMTDLAQLSELGMPLAGISRRNRMVEGLEPFGAGNLRQTSNDMREDAKGGKV